MEAKGGQIPKFGDWKAADGNVPYTMRFESARKRRSMGGTSTAPPKPSPSPARGNSVPSNRGTDANPPKPKDPASRSRGQSSGGHGGSVPPWGQWNENNTGGGAQQYTLVFDQVRGERRSAPATPNVDQMQRPTPPRTKHHNQHDHVPKRFTCFGFCA